ncbi:recombinase family protein [Streptomyces sp. NPDC058221]|uniref:recombinase family protein n=1 Tax=Streptomyces sp. NPDC058221 TaxID=3346388 RepID=UPI0036E533FC
MTAECHPAAGLALACARGSTAEQGLKRRLDALSGAGIPDAQVYVDEKSGVAVEHVGLDDLLAAARPGDTTDGGTGRIAFLLLADASPALFAEMERTFTTEGAARTHAAAGRRMGRPLAHPADKIEYAGRLKEQGSSLGRITTETGVPKTSRHRYLQG